MRSEQSRNRIEVQRVLSVGQDRKLGKQSFASRLPSAGSWPCVSTQASFGSWRMGWWAWWSRMTRFGEQTA